MNQPNIQSQRNVAGITPWLPWPLCRSRLWTEPIRAERLAALRIALGLVLLADILTTYGPHVNDFYGPDSLARIGDTDLFPGTVRADTSPPGWYWSLWRGLGHPVNFGFFLAGWLVLSVWIMFRLTDRPTPSGESTPFGVPQGVPPVPPTEPPLVKWNWLVGCWIVFTTLALLGFWGRVLPASAPAGDADLRENLDALQVPFRFYSALLAVLLACTFLILRSWLLPDQPKLDRPLLAAWALTTVFLLFATWEWLDDWLELTGDTLDLDWLLLPWETDPVILRVLVIAWGIATVSLLIGCCTKLSALLAMVFAFSFDNLNPYLTDTGETVRSLILFYVLLTPCAAVWSVDAWRKKWGRHSCLPDAPVGKMADRNVCPTAVYVSPWPLRLMFLQIVLIYFSTGLYKLVGNTWQDGSSLYLVLSRAHLTRFSFSQLPATDWMLQLGTHVVYFWELTFPLLVLFRWTRVPALLMGVFFHVGIWVTMEIGFFQPYMLCFYVPMAPWEKLSRRKETGP